MYWIHHLWKLTQHNYRLRAARKSASDEQENYCEAPRQPSQKPTFQGNKRSSNFQHKPWAKKTTKTENCSQTPSFQQQHTVKKPTKTQHHTPKSARSSRPHSSTCDENQRSPQTTPKLRRKMEKKVQLDFNEALPDSSEPSYSSDESSSEESDPSALPEASWKGWKGPGL